eukprot:6324799-Prymnesium_polylepis.1
MILPKKRTLLRPSDASPCARRVRVKRRRLERPGAAAASRVLERQWGEKAAPRVATRPATARRALGATVLALTARRTKRCHPSTPPLHGGCYGGRLPPEECHAYLELCHRKEQLV